MNSIFDESILLNLSKYNFPSPYLNLNPLSPNSSFRLRPLSIDDYDNG